MNICPCYDCICVPVCQNKEWTILVQSCFLICEFFRRYEMEIIPNGKIDIDLIPLKQSYRLSKTSNGTITYGVRRGRIDNIVAFKPREQESNL